MSPEFTEPYDSLSASLLGAASLVGANDPNDADYNDRLGEQWLQATAATHIERALNYILTDCFFSLGQGVIDGKGIDHAAVVWVHDHYRAQFFRTINTFGNTWLRDRRRVKGVSRMLGERAAYYAVDKPSIDLAAVLLASTDVKRYCTIHAKRRRRRSGDPIEGQQPLRQAGTWCDPDDPGR